MDALKSVLLTIPWFAWIAIVAIISETVKKTICLSHRHRERMAMIQMGMNPDAPPIRPWSDMPSRPWERKSDRVAGPR